MSRQSTAPGSKQEYDVAIVGAGAAGIAAAISSAALGAKTLLLESEAALGGNIAHAFVHTICGLYDQTTDTNSCLHYANEGFPRKLAEALLSAGIAAPPERAGRVAYLPINPRGFAKFALQLCLRTPQLELALNHPLRHVHLSTQKRVASTLRLGTHEVLARIVLDASGDGVLAALGGADSWVANESELQTASYTVEVGNVATEILFAQALGTLKLSAEIARAAKKGDLPSEVASVHFRRAPNPHSLYLSLNLPRSLTHATLLGPRITSAQPPLPSLAATSEPLLLHAQALVTSVLDFLQRTETTFAQSRVLAYPTQIGVRETRRLCGLEVLDASAVLAGTRRDDEVARSAWPIEIWQDHQRARFQYPSNACSIPLGALMSRSHPQLGMAGRCISATHEALGAVRVIGTALATGEAIGIAAALAAREHLPLASIDPALVRTHILQHAKERLPS